MALRNIVIMILSNLSETKRVLKKVLEEHFDLQILDSSEAALTALRKKIPDAVIVDHSIEGDKIYSFIDRVRNKALTRNLPFILVTRDSSHLSIEKAVRSGVSHYVGIPFEPKLFVERIYLAVTGHHDPKHQSYFEWPMSLEIPVLSYGRISFLTNEGLHFETHLKFSSGDKIHISSPLSKELNEQTLEVQIKSTGTDTYYNYPYAVDANWVSPEIQKKVKSWVATHRSLNSPKKVKVLFVHLDWEFQEKFSSQMKTSHYSVRSAENLTSALEMIPFMRPSCIVLQDADWHLESGSFQKKFIETLDRYKIAWIVFGEKGISIDQEKSSLSMMHAPAVPESIVMAVERLVPPLKPDPDRLYFSKTLEDSRVKFHITGKILKISELGLQLGIPYELNPPCNFQIALKVFEDEGLRNPFVRAWPPVFRLNPLQSEKGRFPLAFNSHFLGINDQLAETIRRWLHQEELKPRIEELKDRLPLGPSSLESEKK